MAIPLIISADDYAQGPAIDHGILDLIRMGRLTATSCLSLSPRWREAATAITSEIRQQADIGQDPDMLPRNKLNAMFENPLGKISKAKLLADVDEFVNKFELQEYAEDFRKGALIAQRPHQLDNIEELTDEDRAVIRREHTHKWHQPYMLYYLVVMCSICAAVQGMDETANNGAQKFFLQVSESFPEHVKYQIVEYRY